MKTKDFLALIVAILIILLCLVSYGFSLYVLYKVAWYKTFYLSCLSGAALIALIVYLQLSLNKIMKDENLN